jgi:hypothetical protein
VVATEVVEYTAVLLQIPLPLPFGMNNSDSRTKGQ